MSAVNYDELRTLKTNTPSDTGHFEFCGSGTLREMSLSDLTTSSSDSYDSLNDSCNSRTHSTSSDSNSDSDSDISVNHRHRRQDQVISFYLDSTVTSSSSQSSSERVDRRQFQTFYRAARSNGLVRSGMAATEVQSAGVVVDRTGNIYHGYKGELRLSIYMNCGLLTVHVQKGRYFTPLVGNERINVQLSLSVPESRDVNCCKTRDVAGSLTSPLFNEKFSLELTEEDLAKRLVVSVWSQSCNSENVANRQCKCVGSMSFGIRHIQQQRIDGWFYVLAADIGRFKHRRVCASRTRHHKKRKICLSRSGRQSMFAERLWVCVPDCVEGSRGFTITGSNPVFIAGVRIGSVADSAGLQPGDRIVSVNGTDVQRLASNEVAAAVRNASGKEIMIEIRRSFRKTNHAATGNSQPLNSCRRQHDGVSVQRVGSIHHHGDATVTEIALPQEIPPGKRQTRQAQSSARPPTVTQVRQRASSKGRKAKTISNATNVTTETVGSSRKHRDGRKTFASARSSAAAAAPVTTSEIVPRQLDRSPRRPRSIIAELKRQVQQPKIEENDESHYCLISHVDNCIPHETMRVSISHDLTCADIPHDTRRVSISHDMTCANIPHDTGGTRDDSTAQSRSLPHTPTKTNPLDVRISKPESDNDDFVRDGHATSPEVTNIHRLSAGRYVYLTGLRTDAEYNRDSADRRLTNVGEVYNVTSRSIGQLFRDVSKPSQSRKSLFITSTPANEFHIGGGHSRIKSPAVTSSSSDGIYELMQGRPAVESHYVDMSSVLGHQAGSPLADVTVVSDLEQGTGPDISGRAAFHGSERRPDVCPSEEFLSMANLDEAKENLYEVLTFDAIKSTPKKSEANNAATSRETKTPTQHHHGNRQQNGKNCKLPSPTHQPNDRLDPLGLLQFAGTPSVGCSGIYGAGKSRSPDVIQPLLEGNCQANGDLCQSHDVEAAQTQCSETAVTCKSRGSKKGKTAAWPLKHRKVSIKEFFGRLR